MIYEIEATKLTSITYLCLDHFETKKKKPCDSVAQKNFKSPEAIPRETLRNRRFKTFSQLHFLVR